MTLADGRDIQSGQVFRANQDEIPQAFRDLVTPLDKEAEQKEPEPEPAQSIYRVEHAGGGWYDVISKETGEAINDKSLRKKEADQLAQEGPAEEEDEDEEAGEPDNE